MNNTLLLLADRRERLVAQAAIQRLALAQNIEPWRAPLARADQGLAVLRYLKRHPALMLGGGLLFMALRPGRAVKWLRHGWVAWRLMQTLHRR